MTIRTMKLASIALLVMTGSADWAAAEVAISADAAKDSALRAADDIIVTGTVTQQVAGTKTATPLIQTPQPITIVSENMFRSQGAINLSDTLNYVAGVTANAYGR